MLRVVIDTNSLETDELRHLLEADPGNRAVIPEHIASEIFRPGSVEAVISAFSVVKDFPTQVIMLWSNSRAARVDPRTGAIANCFIDREATRAFPEFCDTLIKAANGHRGYRQQLLRRREWALERANSVMSALGDQSEALEEIRSNFDESDLRKLARGEKLSDLARATIFQLTNTLANDQLRSLSTRGLVGEPHRYNQFAWRYSLCHVIQLVEMVRKGAVRRKPEKARNDHFDTVVATFGTYFNGVMTNDKGPIATHHIARIVLKALGMPLAIDYLDSDHFAAMIAD
ncbi:hypothetical protein [Tsuneonella sp. SYSU-LHT278]|uniref:hypothetical protein n=1 Tax=Tsuneonella sediminis TaxID=3416089 RepID=UPI003F7A2FCE